MNGNPEKVHIIGIGGDGLAGLTARARDLLTAADVVFGPANLLQTLPDLRGERKPLASDLASFINGAVVGVDGGLLL